MLERQMSARINMHSLAGGNGGICLLTSRAPSRMLGASVAMWRLAGRLSDYSGVHLDVGSEFKFVCTEKEDRVFGPTFRIIGGGSLNIA